MPKSKWMDRIGRAWMICVLGLFVAAGARGQVTDGPFQSPRNVLGAGAAPAAVLGPDTVVAKVNGVPIFQKDLDREVARAMAQLAGRAPAEQVEAARGEVTRTVLEGLITRQLLLQAAEEKGVQVPPEEVAAALRQIESQLPPGQTLEQVLGGQGLSLDQFRENLIQDLRLAKLLTEIVAPVTPPTDKQVEEFYRQNEARMNVPDRVRARHILVRSPETDPKSMREDKRVQAEEIRQKILNGADFAEMVQKHSEDAGSVARGGEYVFGRGQMVPPFEQAAFSQEINAIGPVVETAHGFHVIQVLDRQLAHKQSLEEATPSIRQWLLNQERQKRVTEFIQARRAASKIEILTTP
jgi:peptidyl-prolyl cis-trans isomerase C